MRHTATALLALTVLLATAACSSSDETVDSAADTSTSADGVAGADGSASPDTANTAADDAFTEALNDPFKLIDVHIKLPKADWDLIRHEQRNLDNFLAPKCGSEPFVGNFTYRKATVTVNGVELAEVGVRKKGFVGSITPIKPSLKLKFNKFVKGQFLHGVERMTLNNNRQDAAFLRTCLAYRLFNKGGVPAPRCNFARVRVNGQELGLYSHVESVKKRFLKRNFGDSGGPLYEGTLSDFREGWTATLEPKTAETPTAHEDLAKIVAALELPDDQLLAALDKLIDRPGFLRFWAMEVLVNHFDGYSGNNNNFYLYRLPESGLWTFIPWGTDATFRDGSFDGAKAPSAILVRSRLTRRLYEHSEGQKLYLAALKGALASAWDEADIEAWMTKTRALVGELANDDQLAKIQGTWFDLYYGNMLGWIKTRRKRMDAVLAEPPVWPFPEPGMPCFTPNVQATGAFKTTFGTLQQDAFKVGTGSIKGSNQGTPFDITSAGASTGFNKDNANRVEIRLLFQHPTHAFKFIVIALMLHKDKVKTGEALPLNHFIGGQGGGYMVLFDAPTKQTTLIGGLWKGTLTFNEVGVSVGAEVSGSFDTQWVSIDGAPKK